MLNGKFYLIRLKAKTYIGPSDYHLFRSMKNRLSEIWVTNKEGIKKWLDDFFDAKDEKFLLDGIHKLPEKWEKVVASDEEYFG